jgi:hypothetical protein
MTWAGGSSSKLKAFDFLCEVCWSGRASFNDGVIRNMGLVKEDVETVEDPSKAVGRNVHICILIVLYLHIVQYMIVSRRRNAFELTPLCPTPDILL